MQKPLFIPLNAEHFEDFEVGAKTKEFRVYGSRWNERTCIPGRSATLSCGYGKHRRLYGKVKSFRKVPAAESEGFIPLSNLIAEPIEFIAEIEIELTINNQEL